MKPPMNVVAFEGAWEPRHFIACAAAALSDGVCLINPATGFSAPISELDRLVAEGHLTRLSKPFGLRQEHESSPLVVVALSRRHKLASFFITDSGRGDLIDSHKTSYLHEYLFRDWKSFGQYASQQISYMIQSIMDQMGESRKQDFDPIELTTYGLALDRAHPQLNAIRAFLLGPDKKFALKIARDNVRAEQQKIFDDFYNMLCRIREKGSSYVLKYEHGIADQPALPLGHAVSSLQTLLELRRHTKEYVSHTYPFAGDLPEPRVELAAASAKIVFRVSSDKRTFREQVAMYLELKVLERIMRGEELQGVVIERKLRDKLDNVLRPTQDTIVTQKAVDSEDDEPIEPPVTYGSNVKHTAPFTVLAFQSGLINDAARVEFRMSSKFRKSVSAKDDGSGNMPVGAEVLTSGKQTLFRPALVTLFKEVDDRGHEAFKMTEIQELDRTGAGYITAIPSSVVPGAMMVGVRIRVTKNALATDLSTTIGNVSGIDRASLDGAKDWLQGYEKLCYEFELDSQAGTVQYISPVKGIPVSALERVLVTLRKFGGGAIVADIVIEIGQHSDTPVRDNNTRRVVLYNQEYLEFDKNDPENQRILMTARGAAYLRALQQAVGRPLWPDML